MQLSRPFLRLPWSFDAPRMAREVETLPPDAWMEHPSRMQGNSALALISRDAGDNDEFDGAMGMTPHLRACPYIRQVMASFGEVLGRSRLMRLEPGSEVSLHVDFNYHWHSRIRIHVPVITQPQVIFQCADEQVHMAAGECWIFNSWRRHRVVNAGDRDRVHLVVDTSGSARFWRLVRQLEAAAAHDQPGPPVRSVPFDPAAEDEPETERFNTAPVMAPGEVDGLVAELVSEFEGHPGNDPCLVEHYRELLIDFSKDWRAAWYRHGPHPDGWPRYRAIIEATQARLHRDPRALLTRSNEIGVNPIIVQRILRPALAGEHFDQFMEPAGPGR